MFLDEVVGDEVARGARVEVGEDVDVLVDEGGEAVYVEGLQGGQSVEGG